MQAVHLSHQGVETSRRRVTLSTFQEHVKREQALASVEHPSLTRSAASEGEAGSSEVPQSAAAPTARNATESTRAARSGLSEDRAPAQHKRGTAAPRSQVSPALDLHDVLVKVLQRLISRLKTADPGAAFCTAPQACAVNADANAPDRKQTSELRMSFVMCAAETHGNLADQLQGRCHRTSCQRCSTQRYCTCAAASHATMHLELFRE